MLGAGEVRDHSLDLDRDRAFPLHLYALPAGGQERADDPVAFGKDEEAAGPAQERKPPIGRHDEERAKGRLRERHFSADG
jgi:hypothetical protein